MNRRIILASASPRRKKLLEQLGFDFTVHPSKIEEDFDTGASPSTIVMDLASRKARDVAEHSPDSLVIAADTLVVFRDNVIEKPASEKEAIEMLSLLSGERHLVFTGVALAKTGKERNIQQETTFFVKTEVWFGTLTSEEIRSYVSSGSPMDKAGGYGIQDDWGALFVERIHGDYYNVVGLPLHALYQQLKHFAPEYLEELIK